MMSLLFCFMLFFNSTDHVRFAASSKALQTLGFKNVPKPLLPSAILASRHIPKVQIVVSDYANSPMLYVERGFAFAGITTEGELKLIFVNVAKVIVVIKNPLH